MSLSAQPTLTRLRRCENFPCGKTTGCGLHGRPRRPGLQEPPPAILRRVAQRPDRLRDAPDKGSSAHRNRRQVFPTKHGRPCLSVGSPRATDAARLDTARINDQPAAGRHWAALSPCRPTAVDWPVPPDNCRMQSPGDGSGVTAAGSLTCGREKAGTAQKIRTSWPAPAAKTSLGGRGGLVKFTGYINYAARIVSSSAWRNFSSALFWIWRTRSLVTPIICPTCSNVIG